MIAATCAMFLPGPSLSRRDRSEDWRELGTARSASCVPDREESEEAASSAVDRESSSRKSGTPSALRSTERVSSAPRSTPDAAFRTSSFASSRERRVSLISSMVFPRLSDFSSPSREVTMMSRDRFVVSSISRSSRFADDGSIHCSSSTASSIGPAPAWCCNQSIYVCRTVSCCWGGGSVDGGYSAWSMFSNRAKIGRESSVGTLLTERAASNLPAAIAGGSALDIPTSWRNS